MKYISIVSVLLLSLSSLLSGKEEQKNVLIFFIDDLRPELGCYGTEYIQSPNIDTLASEGIVFDKAYCQQAICGPSRVSMMSGQYPDTLGIHDLWSPLRETVPDAMSMPRYFLERGYVTSSYGKVYHHHHDDRISWSDLPDAPRGKYASPETIEMINKLQADAKAKGLKGVAVFHATQGPAVESADVPDEAYRDGAVAMQAIESLRKNKDKPFFLCVGFAKPHLPFAAPQRYWDLYDREQFSVPERKFPEGSPTLAFTNWGELRAYKGIPKEGPLSDEQTRELRHGYAACVSYSDAQVGKVLAELDRLGLRENTIVILWGDHGYKLGDYGLWCKHTNLELDTHVPFIVSAPGFGKNERREALVEMVDIFPTVAQLTGGEIPESCEGHSLDSVLRDPTTTLRPYAISQYPRGNAMGYSLRTERWRYTEWIDLDTKEIIERELYDHLETDMALRNQANEPDHQDRVATLSKQLNSVHRVETMTVRPRKW